MKFITLSILTILFSSCENIDLAALNDILNESSSTPMVTTWRVGDSSYGDGDNSITLPLRSGYNYDMTVDWGDGETSEITSYTDTEITHIYDSAEVGSGRDYTITITGLAEAWYFNFNGDRDKIISVSDFGDLGWIDLKGAFSGASNLTSFAGGNTSNVTDMSFMFNLTLSLTDLNLSRFDTSNVTDMLAMFQGTSSLTSLDLSSFDTSSVTDMSSMFGGASALISLDLSNFNTSSVTGMNSMFSGASSLTSLDLSSFDTFSVLDMEYMFNRTFSLTSLDISSFDTSNVVSMSYMFEDAISLTSLDLSHFDTSSATGMSFMFSGMFLLATLNVTNWDISHVIYFGEIFSRSNPLLVVSCDQGGSPGTGVFFGENCN